MRIATSRYAAAAVAVLMLAVVSRIQPEVDAFAPTAVPRAKGGEGSGVLFSLAVAPETKAATATAGAAKSTKAKSTSKNKKQKSTSKKKKRKTAKDAGKKRVTVKKSPKRNKGKGRNGVGVKSFKPLKDLKLGSKISGKVVDVCDFGAFVGIGYATRGSRAGTALLHISQIQNEKIDDVRDILQVGDAIEGARVINVDLRKGEVGLSLRTRRPERRDAATIKVGDELEGRVASVVPYGAFVDVGASVNALLHVSRITGGVVENVRHHLNEGDPVSVHVIDLDREKKTMAVSMLDRKADQYLDRRMCQRDGFRCDEDVSDKELTYFDQAIRELEEALHDRGG